MKKGRELWNRLNQDICNYILSSKNDMFVLIGDNSTGKSEIGEMLKDKMNVIDNYRGTLKELPKPDGRKVLLITHDIHLVVEASPYAELIITRPNDLYIVTDCNFDDYSHVVHIMYNANPLSVFLNNAVAGAWSDLNEEYLQEYLAAHELNKADTLVLKTIEDFKKR